MNRLLTPPADRLERDQQEDDDVFVVDRVVAHLIDQRLKIGLLLLGRPHRVHVLPLLQTASYGNAMSELFAPVVLVDQGTGLGIVCLEPRRALARNKRQLPAEDAPFGLISVGQFLSHTALTRRKPRSPAVILGVVSCTHVRLLSVRRPAHPAPHPVKERTVSTASAVSL